MVDDDKITRIELARTPNWKIENPENIKAQWWRWQRVGMMSGNCYATDTRNLTQPAEYYKDATIRVAWGIVMGMPYAEPVESFNVETKTISFPNPGYGIGGAGPQRC